ncbi:MAG: hypothetical protein JWM31_689, partial [Solirubrobacterales bacterium]|nr:hypothetical protein [Solirubrobacterales bacterium]
TREQRQQKEVDHLEARGKVLDAPGISYLSTEDSRFLKRNLSKRPPSTLETPLRYCLDALPVDLSPSLEGSKLVKQLLSEGATSMPDALRIVRNDLAHGNRGYDMTDLRELAELLDRVARAHLLRVLGCPESAQKRVLQR